MSNMLTHAAAVGAQTLQQRPFDALDALILSQIVYLPMEGFADWGEVHTIAQAFAFLQQHTRRESLGRIQQKRWQLMEVCAAQPRYAAWEMTDFVNEIDHEKEMQFCAATFRLPDGLSVIAFRGTDMTIAGWKEDLNMSFMTVPSQHEAAEYVYRIARQTGDALIFCGHSKGGNLSVYAAATTDASTRERIRRVYTFDGPGVDAGTLTSTGYALITPRIESYIPESSVVGMLLHYHPVYTVVDSGALGILQHDAMTWRVEDGAFVTVASVDAASRVTDEALHDWLAEMDMEERRLLVDTLYEVVDAAQAVLVTDLVEDWQDNAGKMLDALRDIDPAVKRDVLRMMGELFSSGASEVVRSVLASLTRRRG